MRIRPYISALDFETLRHFSADARTHALWCANRFAYPLEQQNFDSVLAGMAEEHGECPFMAFADDSTPVGFFCFSLDVSSREGMLKFVITAPALRGKGYGRQMLALAAKYAFGCAGAGMLHLNVFTANAPALCCYTAAGFRERSTTENAFCFQEETWGRCNMVLCPDKS